MKELKLLQTIGKGEFGGELTEPGRGVRWGEPWESRN
jgi:hypothetical protein